MRKVSMNSPTLCFWLGLLLLTTVASAQSTTVYPTEDLSVLKNPGRGFTVYANDLVYDTKFTDGVWSTSSLVYLRISWSQLEPTEGNFNWALIDDSMAVAAGRGDKLGLAIMLAVINSDTSYRHSTPLWVFSAGAKSTTEMVEGGTVAIKIPVWNDPIMKSKLQNLITAIKNRYDNNSNLAFIDIRNYGNWGEWHLGNLPNSAGISYADKQSHVDMWSAFLNTRVIMVNTTFDQTLSSEARYAFDTYQTGIRRDGCVNPDSPNAHLSLISCYNVSPAIAEWWDKYSYYKNIGKWSPVQFEKVMNEGKPSYIGMSIHDENVFYTEQKAFVDKWANRIGYWFKITKASYSTNLGNGTSGTIQLTVKNDGVAPIYPNKANIGYVKLALLNASDAVVSVTTLSGINPFNWKPGEFVTESASFSFPYNASGAKLAIGVFTSNSPLNPDVKLGSGDRLASGWHVLSAMPQTEPGEISANKLYRGSSQFADSAYGYREARYAFDRNTASKWVAESSLAGEWLEVDFGEAKAMAGAYLLEDAAAITGYRIEYFDGTNWRTAYTGSTIGTVGQAVNFPAVSGRKARLYVTAASAAPRISEFTLFRPGVSPTPPGFINMDNEDASGIAATGAWATSNSLSGYVGTNYWHDGNSGGVGGKSVTYTPAMTTTGNYNVYLQYTSYSNRASNVPVDIVHAGGTATYYVDQRTGGGNLVEVGSGFPFAAGGGWQVRIRNDGANGYIVADAVVLAPTTPGSRIIELDNSSTGVVKVGAWTSSQVNSGYIGSDYVHDGNAGSAGGRSVRYTAALPVTGFYKVYLNFTSGTNRASNVPVDIMHAGGASTVQVNQQSGGGTFVDLGGVYLFDSGQSSSVVIRNDGANGYVIADAVRWVLQ